MNPQIKPTTTAFDFGIDLSPKWNSVLYVSKTGDDESGQRGNYYKPFKTIEKAVNVATAGDTVYVYSGLYEVSSNLLQDKSNINFYFSSGVIINSEITIFETTQNCVVRILGYGEFVLNDITNSEAILRSKNSEDDVIIQGSFKLLDEGTVFDHENGKLIVLGNSTLMDGGTGLKHSGSGYVHIIGNIDITETNNFGYPVLIQASTSTSPNNTSEIRIDGDIENQQSIVDYTGAGRRGVVQIESSERTIINITGNIRVNSATIDEYQIGILMDASNSDSVELNHKGRIISTWNSVVIEGGVMNVNGSEVSSLRNVAALVDGGRFNSTRSLIRTNVNDQQADNKGAVTVVSGFCKINQGVVLNSYGIAALANSVHIIGGTVILTGCRLISDAVGANSIYSDDPQNVKIYKEVSANLAVNPNITNVITGTNVLVDANVEV